MIETTLFLLMITVLVLLWIVIVTLVNDLFDGALKRKIRMHFQKNNKSSDEL